MNPLFIYFIIVVVFNYLLLNGLASKNDTVETYYDINEIIEETHWNDVGVQENIQDIEFKYSHLSLISQNKYYGEGLYDSNYYYPASAGKGIDIYIIDTGLNVTFSEEDFDTYEGTPDERVVKCEGQFYNGELHPVPDEKHCHYRASTNNSHGTVVALTAAGKIHGVAKKGQYSGDCYRFRRT